MISSPRKLCHLIAIVAVAGVWCATPAQSAEPLVIEVDFGRTNGFLRPLHGINKGPLAAGGLIDLTESQRALGIPFTRLHDCHWPNPDVVDIHAVFPNMAADPSRAGNYDFTLTDAYLAAVQKTGARIIYRLGESIEHTPHKRFVHPPPDAAKWASICIGIIRHFNEGWANGFRYGIDYWEIWNEPENRPAMWSGSDQEYFQLYRVAASAIKRHNPHIKVGGPAAGFSGQFVGGIFQPSAFVTNFLEVCRRENVPLDFFSWHCYTADPAELAQRARAIRQLLNERGFDKTESHLNEWNYLPGNSWKPISRSSTPEHRQDFYREMAGTAGAAFILSALIELQDAPVDVCNLFHGELGGFGLFNEHGVPSDNYHALRAWNELTRSYRRVVLQGSVVGKLDAIAAVNPDSTEAVLLITNVGLQNEEVSIKPANLPWKTPTQCEIAL